MQSSCFGTTLLVSTAKLAKLGIVGFTGFVPSGYFLPRDWVDEIRIEVESAVSGALEEFSTAVA